MPEAFSTPNLVALSITSKELGRGGFLPPLTKIVLSNSPTTIGLKCSFFITFKFLHDAVSKMCRLEFRFQNLPFSKSASKNVPFSCEREAYPSNFSPFSKCASVVCKSVPYAEVSLPEPQCV